MPKIVTLNDIHRLLDGLTLQEKEALLAEQLRGLPAESRSRVMGFSNSGSNVVNGLFVPKTCDVALNTQNARDFDPDTFFERLADFWNSDRKKKKD